MVSDALGELLCAECSEGLLCPLMGTKTSCSALVVRLYPVTSFLFDRRLTGGVFW